GKLLARAAPFRPEVDEHEAGLRWIDDIAPERRNRLFIILAQAQGGHALSPAACRLCPHMGWNGAALQERPEFFVPHRKRDLPPPGGDASCPPHPAGRHRTGPPERA